MPQERIKYYGSFTYNERQKRSEFRLFDFVTNSRMNLIVFPGTKEEGLFEYGKMQKEYYKQYPRLLPKGIAVTDNNHSKNFQLYIYLPEQVSPMYIESFVTVQDAIKFKKELFALNVV